MDLFWNQRTFREAHGLLLVGDVTHRFYNFHLLLFNFSDSSSPSSIPPLPPLGPTSTFLFTQGELWQAWGVGQRGKDGGRSNIIDTIMFIMSTSNIIKTIRIISNTIINPSSTLLFQWGLCWQKNYCFSSAGKVVIWRTPFASSLRTSATQILTSIVIVVIFFIFIMIIFANALYPSSQYNVTTIFLGNFPVGQTMFLSIWKWPWKSTQRLNCKSTNPFLSLLHHHHHHHDHHVQERSWWTGSSLMGGTSRLQLLCNLSGLWQWGHWDVPGNHHDHHPDKEQWLSSGHIIIKTLQAFFSHLVRLVESGLGTKTPRQGKKQVTCRHITIMVIVFYDDCETHRWLHQQQWWLSGWYSDKDERSDDGESSCSFASAVSGTGDYHLDLDHLDHLGHPALNRSRQGGSDAKASRESRSLGAAWGCQGSQQGGGADHHHHHQC